jgi:hypothetical protein
MNNNRQALPGETKAPMVSSFPNWLKLFFSSFHVISFSCNWATGIPPIFYNTFDPTVTKSLFYYFITQTDEILSKDSLR